MASSEAMRTYSGGTAPESNRLPFYALAGTRNAYSVVRPRIKRSAGHFVKAIYARLRNAIGEVRTLERGSDGSCSHRVMPVAPRVKNDGAASVS